MSETARLTHYLAVLNKLPTETLALRLKTRRLRRFKSAADAGRAIEQAGGPVSRSYRWHESGDPRRRPDLQTLALYARVFGTTLEYLLFGDDDGEAIDEIMERFRSSRPQPQRQINDAGSRRSQNPVNQEIIQQPFSSSHNSPLRSIVVLTAKQIRQLSDDVGALTRMSGRKIAVPDALTISANSFWYTVPAHDVSMVDRDGPLSLYPGAICLIDLEAPILRGKCVLAQLRGFDEPVVRVFQADRPYDGTGSFSLTALNPHFEAIVVENAEDCPLLGRIMFQGSLL